MFNELFLDSINFHSDITLGNADNGGDFFGSARKSRLMYLFLLSSILLIFINCHPHILYIPTGSHTARLLHEKGAVSVVDDQIGSPTYTYDLARLLVDMIQTDKYGRYHATNEGLCSWYEFACEIFRQAGMDEVKVTPVDSDGFPAKAKRPSNSRMSKEKLTENGFERLPSWQNALERYLKALKDNGMA